MTLALRPIDLNRDGEEFIAILRRNLPALDHTARFRWLYMNNPIGPGQSWAVYEKNGERTVGVASVFPRALWVNGSTYRCGQVGDFAIDRSHRSLGPAVLLQRATLTPVERGELAFCYDCPPHDQGMSPFRRLGIEPSSQMARFVWLLRAERVVRRHVRTGLLVKPLASLMNALLRLMTSRSRPSPGIEVSITADRFGEEYSELDQRAQSCAVIRGCRTSADLNWRYRDDPLNRFVVFTARRHGELLAYAVLRQCGDDAELVDLFGVELNATCPVLIQALSEYSTQKRLQTVQAVVSHGHVLSAILRKARFWNRSKGAWIVAYGAQEPWLRAQLGAASYWQFNYADTMA